MDYICSIFGVSPYLDGTSANGMFESEAKYWCAEVVADFLLLGIEADALADDGRVGTAGGTPYGKGEFEADGEDAEVRF